MTAYLISFPSREMQLSEDEFAAAGRDSRRVVNEMREAGVLVYAGGIDEATPAIQVARDGTILPADATPLSHLDGGFTVINVATQDEAIEWASKIAVGCHAPQGLRSFMDDPESATDTPER